MQFKTNTLDSEISCYFAQISLPSTATSLPITLKMVNHNKRILFKEGYASLYTSDTISLSLLSNSVNTNSNSIQYKELFEVESNTLTWKINNELDVY